MNITITKYDLTRGMAKSMCSTFVGNNSIEGIWHTGIMIDGIEYFYGNGIQHLEHGEFIKLQGNLFPCETFDYGETKKTKQEIEGFILKNGEKYSIEKYNLIENNCNHFTNDFSKFLVDKEIPKEIVNQAKNIINTMGAFIGGFFKQASEEFHKSNCKLLTKE